MADEFRAEISLELKAGEIDRIKSEITNIQTNPIKLTIDDSNVQSQIKKIENQIKSLSGIKINLSGNGVGAGFNINTGNLKQTTTDVQKAYTNLMNLQRNISSIKLKLGGISDGSNTQQIKIFSQQLQSLESEYTKLLSTFSNDLSPTQFNNIANASNNLSLKFEQLKAKMQDLAVTNFDKNVVSDTAKITEKFESLKLKTNEVQQAMIAFKTATSDMQAAKQSGDVDRITQAYERYKIAVKDVNTEIQNSIASEKLTNARTNLSQKMDIWLRDNSAAAAQFGGRIKQLQVELQTCSNTRLTGIKAEFQQITNEANLAGKATMTFGDRLKTQLGNLSVYFSGSMLIMRTITTIREAINTVTDLDTALVDLQKTTTASASQLQKFFYEANDAAKQYGTTTQEIIQSAADWSRLGYSLTDSQLMAKYSSQMKSISPGMTIDEATKGLVSSMKAYGIEADDVLDGLMSKINIVGNTAATSNTEIVNGLQRSSAAMAAMGSTVEENIALFTAGEEITQNADKMGTALRTIAMRIRGYNEETEQLDEELVNITGDVIDLTKTASNPKGVSLFTDETQTEYKSVYQYLEDISEIYDELDAKQKQQLLEKLFGKMRASEGAAILNNFSAAQKAMDNMANSAGSADREMGVIEQSMEYKLNNLKQTAVGVFQNLLDRDDLKGAVDALTGFLIIIDKLTEKLGLLPTLGLTLGGIFAFNNRDMFSQIPVMISNLNKLGASIQALNGLNISMVGVNPVNITAFQSAIQGLSAEQAVLALSTQGATAAQIEEIMTTETATLAKDTYTQADVQAALAKQGLVTTTTVLTAAQQAEMASALEGTGVTMSQVASVLGLTTAENGNLVSKEALTAANVKQQLSSIGVVGAQQEQIVSMLGLTAAETAQVGVTNVLTGAWNALKVAIMSNPIGAILVGVTAVIAGVIAYTKHLEKEAEEAADKIREIHQDAESALNKSKSDLQSAETELQNVQSQLSSIKDEISSIVSKGDLSFVDKRQIENLTQTKSLLEAQEQTLKNTIELQQRANANNAKSLLETNYETFMYDSMLDSVTGERSKHQGEKESYTYKKWAELFSSGYHSNAHNQYLKAIEEGNEENIKYWEDIVNANESQIASFTNELYSIIGNMQNADGTIIAGYEDLYNEYMGYINNLQSLTDPNIFNSLMSSWSENSNINYEELYEEAIKDAYGMDEFDIKNINQDFINALAENGIDESTVSSILREKKAIYDSVVNKIDKAYNTDGILEPSYWDADGSIHHYDKDSKEFKEYEEQVDKVKKINDSLKSHLEDNPSEFQIIFDSKSMSEINDYIDEELKHTDDVEVAVTNALNRIREEITEINGTTISLSYDTLKKDTEGIISQISKLNEVLNAQSTGTSISLENYNADELSDYQSALEYVNGTMQLNEEKVKELAKAKVEEQIATNNATKAQAETKYLENAEEIEKLRQKLVDKKFEEDESEEAIRNNIQALLDENETLSLQNDQITLLNSNLSESIGLYQQWKDAQNSSESGDMFDDTLTAINQINDTLNNTKFENYGKVGRKDYQASLDLIIPESVDSEDEEAINNYLKSIAEMFTYDDDGNRAGLNVAKFCDEAVKQGLMVIDEKSEEYKIAGSTTMEDFAEGLNMSMPLVQAMFGELQEYGAEFDWGDEIYKTFGDGILACTEQISDLESELDELTDAKNRGIEIDDSRLTEIQKKLKEIQGEKEKLSEESKINIDTYIDTDDKIDEATEKVENLKEKLSNTKDKDTRIKVKAEIDEAEKSLADLQSKKDELQEPTIVELRLASNDLDTQIANIQAKLDNYKNQEWVAKFAADLSEGEIQTKIDNLQSKIDGLKSNKAKIDAKLNDEEALAGISNLQDEKVDDKSFNITAIDEATSVINNVRNALDGVHDKEVKIKVTKEGSASISGTANLSGTANAKGDWGNKTAGRSLVGELGREIIVDPHTGKWYTVGDNGAEFVDVPKGAIVFNHKQTEDLLSQGFVSSRAMALLNGTAFASGNAFVTGGIKIKNTETSTAGKNTSSSSSKKSDSSYKSKSKSDSEDKADSILDKFSDWISKFFDWIEVKIDRIQTKIDKSVKTAEQALDDEDYTKAAKNYQKAIKQTASLIETNEQGSQRYTKQANRIANKAISDGIVSKSEMANIKKLVKNGAIDIAEYSDEMQEVIKDYKDMYDKAQNCSNALQDLNIKMKEYYTSLYNLPLEKASNAIDKLSVSLDVLTAKSDAVSGGSKLYNKIVVSDAQSEKQSADNALNQAKSEKATAQAKVKKTSNKLAKDKGLTKAQKKAVKKGNEVSTKGLKGQTLKDAKAYNKAVAANKSANTKVSNAREKAKTANTAYNQAVAQQRRYENAADYQMANDLLDQQTAIAKQQNQENQKALKTANSNLKDAQSDSKKAKKATTKAANKLSKDKGLTKAQKNAAKNGKKVSTKGLTGKALKDAKAYNKALKAQKNATTALTAAQNAQTTAVQNAETSQAEYTQTLQDNTKAKLDNIVSSFEDSRSINSAIESNLSSQISNKKKTGKTVTRSDYADIIKTATDDANVAKSTLDAYRAEYNANKDNLSEADNKAALEQIQKLEQAWYDAQNAVVDYKLEAIQAEIDNTQNVINRLKAEGELLAGAYEKNKNINSQITNTRQYYDLLIEQEVDATKQAELRAEKEKAVRDLLQEQLDNIKAQNSYTADWYTTQGSVYQAQNETLREATGKDNATSRYQVAMYNKSVQEGVAKTNRENAQSLFNSLHTSDYGQYNANGEFVVWSHMYEQYMKGMADYRNMLADSYKAEAEAAQAAYDAWVAWYLEPKQKALEDLQTTAEILNAQIDIANAKGVSTTANQYYNLINNSKLQQYNLENQNRLLKEQQALYQVGSTKYRELQSQIDDNSKSILAAQKNQVEWNNAIAQIPFDNIEKVLSKLDAIKSNYESLLSIRQTRGLSQTIAEYRKQISYANDEIMQYTQERNLALQNYNKALASNEGVFGGKTATEWYTEYMQYDTSINNLKNDIEEYSNAIAQIPFDNIEKALDKLSAYAENRKSKIDLKFTLGQDLSANDYLNQIKDNNDKIAKYQEERSQAYTDYLLALSNSDRVYGGKTSDEWLQQYYQFDTQINELKESNEDLKDALRDDVYWRTYERAHDAAKRYADVISGIKNLISDDMYFDADGNLTKWGVSQIANIVSQYETARDEVQNYSNDIDNLNSLYTQGYYTQDEYIKKLNEIQTSMLDSASSMKSYINEIIDMYKKLSQTELDSLLKLIDARNEALSAKKSYYDYDKTIRGKTKDIQSLEAQIAALEGVEGAEGAAKRAKLNAQLKESQDDLNDTINQHMIELSQDALNKLKETLQEANDDKWNELSQDLGKITELMATANALSSAQSSAITNTLNQLSNFYGIDSFDTSLSGYIGYANGTTGVNKNRLVWTNEHKKPEMIVRKSDGAILVPLNQGDGVIPNNMVGNLFEWGSQTPQEFIKDLVGNTPVIPQTNNTSTNIEQHYDSLIQVQGNVDSTVVTDLNKLTKDLYKGAYEYTIKEVTKDARKGGLKI